MQTEIHEKAIYLYIHGLLQLASKHVLSDSDCLKINGFPWGKLAVLPQTLWLLLTGPTSKGGDSGKGKEGRGDERGC